jgi:tryptophan synthase beta chain
MYTLGHSFVPPPVHAGGLRYHGMAPIVCHLHKLGFIEARAEYQIPVFKAAVQFARTEGIIPAPEPSHAIKVVIDEALKCRKTGEGKTILFNCSGHGNFDMTAYDAFYSGQMVDFEYPDTLIKESIERLPKYG